MKTLAIVAGALAVGAAVWLSVWADAAALWHGAGVWALTVLAFPAFIASGVYFTDHQPTWWQRRYWRREAKREARRRARWEQPL